MATDMLPSPWEELCKHWHNDIIHIESQLIPVTIRYLVQTWNQRKGLEDYFFKDEEGSVVKYYYKFAENSILTRKVIFVTVGLSSYLVKHSYVVQIMFIN
jgi:hypothetical protein